MQKIKCFDLSLNREKYEKMKKEIKIQTKDNTTIASNYYNNGHESVVIIAPGWYMTKDAKAFVQIASIFEKDFDILSFDFRGHGKSSGFYTFMAKEIYDIESVVNFAKKKGYKKIYLLGFSLGASAVLIHSAKNKDVDKVIAVSAPTDFNKIEKAIWKKEAWWETIKKFELSRILVRHSFRSYPRIKPIDIINGVSVPTLFMAGEKDPTINPWHTELLYKVANCKKEYKLYKNGYHAEDLYLYFKEDFAKTCLDWLKN